jgi:hypothetical protein
MLLLASCCGCCCRRYTYKAAEDVGGFCFENGKAVSITA